MLCRRLGYILKCRYIRIRMYIHCGRVTCSPIQITQHPYPNCSDSVNGSRQRAGSLHYYYNTFKMGAMCNAYVYHMGLGILIYYAFLRSYRISHAFYGFAAFLAFFTELRFFHAFLVACRFSHVFTELPLFSRFLRGCRFSHAFLRSCRFYHAFYGIAAFLTF